MPLNVSEIQLGEIISKDKGKYENMNFRIVSIKEKYVLIQFKHPLPEDKNIKVSISALEKNYTTRSSYLRNLFSTKY